MKQSYWTAAAARKIANAQRTINSIQHKEIKQKEIEKPKIDPVKCHHKYNPPSTQWGINTPVVCTICGITGIANSW